MRVFILAILVWSLALLESSAQSGYGRAPRLASERHKSGAETTRTFAPVAAAARGSVAQLQSEGKTVALAAIVGTDGWLISKASEIRDKPGLRAALADGEEWDAELAAQDEENDVALLKINATELTPVQWTPREMFVGQWAVSPGIAELPEAVGIISVPPRKIAHRRAFIGVQLDLTTPAAKIAQVMSGLGAEKAGLQPGDFIVAVNGTAVKRREQLIETLRKFREGHLVNVRVKREEKEFEASIQLMVPTEDDSSGETGHPTRRNRFAGDLSQRAEGFDLAIQHDTVLHPWQCGGPLINLEGEAIGLNIARAGRVASFALPAELVQRIVLDLKGKAGKAGMKK